MSDERPEDDPAIQEAMARAEAAIQKKIDGFDALMREEEYQPLTRLEHEAGAAAFEKMSPLEQQAWNRRVMIDNAHTFANILRIAATSDCDARPWQLNSVDFYIGAATAMVRLCKDVNKLTGKLNLANTVIAHLRATTVPKPIKSTKAWRTPKSKGSRWLDN